MPETETVRLGLVGLGDWGEHVVLAARQVPGAVIAGGYSRSAETRRRFAQRFGCAVHDTYETMLTDDTLAGIVLMTPNNAHRQPVVAAAQHGKHCLVTKPIAASVEDATAMIQACDRAGVLLAVGHQSRREPALRALKRLLLSGELGTPVSVEANISTAGGREITPGQWRDSRAECPGGPLIQLGVHHIDTLQYLLGPISRVLSWQRRSVIDAEIDDVTTTLLEFAGSLAGYLGSSYASAESCWIKIYATRANVHYDQHTGLTISRDSWEEGPRREEIAAGIPLFRPIPTMVEEIAEFADCIRTGKQPEIDGRQGLRNLAVVLAAVRSAVESRPVAVEELLPCGIDVDGGRW